MKRTLPLVVALVAAAAVGLAPLVGQEKPKPKAKPRSYRLPGVSLKEQVIWGATCELPDGTGLAFGGQDQKADDGNPHTRIKVDGKWVSIHPELKAKNALEAVRVRVLNARDDLRVAAAQTRGSYLHGVDKASAAEVERVQRRALQAVAALRAAASDAKESPADRERLARAAALFPDATSPGKHVGIDPEFVRLAFAAGVALEQAAEVLDCEPAPRALSPVVYDDKHKLFVLFGGDHLDYLTNDTWVFDPARREWSLRRPKSAPPPRANHKLVAADGKVTLAGGYTYTNSTDYVGGQYRDHDDGDWVYDVAADAWTGGSVAGVPPTTRVYRSGPFHPDFYLREPAPDAAAGEAKLKALPANTWVSMDPPHLPKLNRDWGTAVLDADRDLILRFSGGHSAHGGTDVLHYHLPTNRWELCFPVEFPLGQLYANTEYPHGFNFNRRPWVTGHTYQNYGYDPVAKLMFFTGETNYCYVYDPSLGDWTGRLPKPPGMVYNSCFYTLTCTPTPAGLHCWTQNGKVYRFAAVKNAWEELPLKGKLPGSVVDNSTCVLDSKRNRLLFVRKPYGDKTRFDGKVYSLDLATLETAELSPAGDAQGVPYLCQLRYDPEHDLLLVGGTLPPGEDGLRRTPAYDCAGNRWASLKIAGQDPSGKNGRNVSLGMMYDPKRRLFWAVDTNSRVYVLRLKVAEADLRPL